MIDIYHASLADILPDSLKADKQFTALAKALDPLLKKFAKDTRKAMHLPRLDELSGIILDTLADQFHCDFYNATTLTDVQKRNLIRQSIALHRRKGTPWAVECVANQFFHNPQVQELEGFLFKITAGEYTAAPEAFETFYRMLFDAKPVRSWLVGIDSDISPPNSTLYTGGALAVEGKLLVDFKRPKGSTTRLCVGNPLLVQGDLTFNLSRPKSSKVEVHIGCPFMALGHVLIDSKTRPLLRTITENPTADLAIADKALARGDNFIEPPLYDWLKIFFKFPTDSYPRRFITIRNPRDDLTKAEIKRVADFAVDNELLLNRRGQQVCQAPRAHLIAKKITTLI